MPQAYRQKRKLTDAPTRRRVRSRAPLHSDSPAQPQPQLQSKPPLMVRLPLLLTGSGGFSNSQQQITPKMQVSSSSHSCA